MATFEIGWNQNKKTFEFGGTLTSTDTAYANAWPSLAPEERELIMSCPDDIAGHLRRPEIVYRILDVIEDRLTSTLFFA